MTETVNPHQRQLCPCSGANLPACSGSLGPQQLSSRICSRCFSTSCKRVRHGPWSPDSHNDSSKIPVFVLASKFRPFVHFSSVAAAAVHATPYSQTGYTIEPVAG